MGRLFNRFDLINLFFSNFHKICILRQEASYQAKDMLNGSFSPAMIWFTKILMRTKDFINKHMFDVFGAVVIDDTFGQVFWVLA